MLYLISVFNLVRPLNLNSKVSHFTWSSSTPVHRTKWSKNLLLWIYVKCTLIKPTCGYKVVKQLLLH